MTEKTSSLMLAIDLGGTSVKMAIYTLEDRDEGRNRVMPQCLCRTSIPTKTEDGGVSILPDIAEAASRLAEENWMSVFQFTGIGIGVPGPVITLADGREIVNGCVNLNWDGPVDVVRILGELTGADQIRLLNDANAAALGEFYFGEADAEGTDAAGSACMVTLGTGIGGGIIHGGSIITGAFGAAGEIGHMPVEPAGKLIDLLRRRGVVLREDADLEYFASATGVARFARLALGALDTPSSLRSIPEDQLEAKDVFDAAKAEDELACMVSRFFFDTLGRGLASISSVIDPDLFIIGGGVSAAGDFLLEGVRESYRSCVFKPSLRTRFRLASLGNDAGLLGAIVPLIR